MLSPIRNLTEAMRHGWTLFGISLVLAVAPGRAYARIEAGNVFPTLNAFSLAGAVPDCGGKVTIVDFWASWCGPCRASFPALSQLRNDYRDEVAIVGVSVDESASAYSHFIQRFKPSFPTVRDESQKLVTAVEVPTMPTSYLLDRHGTVRFVHVGFHDSTPGELRREINLLLKEAP